MQFSLALLSSLAIGMADDPAPKKAEKPQGERRLSPDDLERMNALNRRALAAEIEDRYDKVIEFREEMLALHTETQGADYWQTITARWELDAARKVARLPADSRAEWQKAQQAAVAASQWLAQRQYEKAQPLLEKYRDWCVKVFGPKHMFVAISYNNLAQAIGGRRLYREAQPVQEQALGIVRDVLGEHHPVTANLYHNLANNLELQGKSAEAQPLFQKCLEIRREVFGEKHRDVAMSYHFAANNLLVQRQYADARPLYQKALDINREALGEFHYNTAATYRDLAKCLFKLKKYADAQSLYQKALDIRLKLYGEKTAEAAVSYSDVAACAWWQAKYDDAHAFYVKALNIRREIFGENNRDTAAAYFDVANTLNCLEKHPESQLLFQKSLDIRLQLFGENHAEVLQSLLGLASSLNWQRNFKDAQPLYQKALDLGLESVGEKSKDVAWAYHGLGSCLLSQGKVDNAKVLYRKSIDIHRELSGDLNVDVADGYRALAFVLLLWEKKFVEAQPYFQKALDIYRELHGNPEFVIQCHVWLADCLLGQDKVADAKPHYTTALDLIRDAYGEKNLIAAEKYRTIADGLRARFRDEFAFPFYQKALDLYRELRGEEHLETADAYYDLGENRGRMHRYAEARELLQHALDLYRELLGENHLSTIRCLKLMADHLVCEDHFAEALKVLSQAAAAYEPARLKASSRQLNRLEDLQRTPYPAMATLHAHLGAPEAAWLAAETDLARVLAEETAAFQKRTPTSDQQMRLNSLNERLGLVQSRVLELIKTSKPTDLEKDELARLKTERGRLEKELSGLAIELRKRDVASLAEVQSALPEDAALIFWVDYWSPLASLSNWGCVVRRTGAPAWERLPINPDEKEQSQNEKWYLWHKVGAALRGGATPAAELAELIQRLRVQRMAPLTRHLAGVKRLYVVPVSWMTDIPIELLSTEYTVSYVPSGTYLARIKDGKPPTGSALLALGDPVYSRDPAKAAAPLPPGGLYILQVAPDGAAAKARLQAGDVLLRYGDAELINEESLDRAIQSQANAREVPIVVWRQGVEKPFSRLASPGRLGVVLAKEPAAKVVADRRKSDAVFQAVRGGDWNDLPATRSETTRIAQLFGPTSTLLMDSAASEQSLDDLRRKGELAKYRYLHFATHGQANSGVLSFATNGKANTDGALDSFLILAQDALPKNAKPRAGEPLIDGQLSAREVLEFWELNAELVTLSACETGLGFDPRSGGEGLLGFSQAFLSRGSRAVCLSLWKVDDAATALLMIRFYENLLGKRPELSAPMPKAEALAEAKRWLRELTSEEALKFAAAATNGIVRGERSKDQVLRLAVPSSDPKSPGAKGVKPFAHPRYWAAFILIGDPN